MNGRHECKKCKFGYHLNKGPYIDFCPLHAAAPELLEACKYVQKWLCENGPVKDDGITNRYFVKANNAVNAAIAKAEEKTT